MILWIYVILALFLGALGCQSPTVPASVTQPSVKGLKMHDLIPPDYGRTEPVVVFLVTLYHILPEQTPAAWMCCEGMPPKAIAFSDAQAFSANGFAAMMGSGIYLSGLLGCLEKMGAVRFGQNTLVVNPDSEMPFSEFPVAGQMTLRHGTDVVKLKNGTLGWKLKAHLEPPSLLSIAAEIEPVFVPHQVAAWPGAERYAEQLTYRFQSGQMKASFREGDFLVLTARHDNEAEMTDLERILFFQPDPRPRTRLYVLVFARAEQ